jgi:hypothetical protein
MRHLQAETWLVVVREIPRENSLGGDSPDRNMHAVLALGLIQEAIGMAGRTSDDSVPRYAKILALGN